MSEQGLNIERQYPELFAKLDANMRRAVVQSVAAGWHAGWNPTREDVENLTDYARGAIDADEYGRRADEAAHRAAAVARRAASESRTWSIDEHHRPAAEIQGTVLEGE